MPNVLHAPLHWLCSLPLLHISSFLSRMYLLDSACCIMGAPGKLCASLSAACRLDGFELLYSAAITLTPDRQG